MILYSDAQTIGQLLWPCPLTGLIQMYVFPIDLSALLFQLCQLRHSERFALGIQYGSDHIWQCKALCDGTAHGVQCAHVNIYWLKTHTLSKLNL